MIFTLHLALFWAPPSHAENIVKFQSSIKLEVSLSPWIIYIIYLITFLVAYIYWKCIFLTCKKITCCFTQSSIYRVLQENKNLKRLLSGRTLLNPGVGPVLTINLAGAVGRDGEVSLTNSYDGWLIADETNDTRIRALKEHCWLERCGAGLPIKVCDGY